MVTLQSAENALKNVYLGIVANQLNVASNPLLAQIKHSTNHIYGKEIRKAAPIGINGGIGAGDEDGALPKAGENRYVQYVAQLKNLYGRLMLHNLKTYMDVWKSQIKHFVQLQTVLQVLLTFSTMKWKN